MLLGVYPDPRKHERSRTPLGTDSDTPTVYTMIQKPKVDLLDPPRVWVVFTEAAPDVPTLQCHAKPDPSKPHPPQ